MPSLSAAPPLVDVSIYGCDWGAGGAVAVYLDADRECRGGGDRSGTKPGTAGPEGPEGTSTSDGSGCDGAHAATH